MAEKKQHVLFVCTAGMQRSPTAADLVNEHAGERYEAHAVGTHPLAAMQVTQEHIDWADTIVALSEETDGHLSYIQKHFDVRGKDMHDLGIPDTYSREDPELVALLKDKLPDCLDITF